MMFQDKIKGLFNFSDIRGSTSYVNLLQRIMQEVKRVIGNIPTQLFITNIYQKKSKIPIKKSCRDANKQNTDVVSSFGNMSEQTFLKLNIKFETTYFAVRNELSISAPTNILRLEVKRDVVVGMKYMNDSSIRAFTNYIGDDLKQELYSDYSSQILHCVVRWIY